jgi:hypothetical protein
MLRVTQVLTIEYILAKKNVPIHFSKETEKQV